LGFSLELAVSAASFCAALLPGLALLDGALAAVLRDCKPRRIECLTHKRRQRVAQVESGVE
jgi:hypothetical protein